MIQLFNRSLFALHNSYGHCNQRDRLQTGHNERRKFDALYVNNGVSCTENLYCWMSYKDGYEWGIWWCWEGNSIGNLNILYRIAPEVTEEYQNKPQSQTPMCRPKLEWQIIRVSAWADLLHCVRRKACGCSILQHIIDRILLKLSKLHREICDCCCRSHGYTQHVCDYSNDRRHQAVGSDTVIWMLMLRLTHRVTGGSKLYSGNSGLQVSQVYGRKRLWATSRGKVKLFINSNVH
jgi:hypothetical protein